MPTSKRDAQRCRERAASCRRLAAQAREHDLRDSYLRLALSYDVLADSVQQLDHTDRWFAFKLAEPAPRLAVTVASR